MSRSSHLRGDLDLLLAILAAARHAEPGEAMPWDVLAALLQPIHCDGGVQYQDMDVTHERVAFRQGLSGERLGVHSAAAAAALAMPHRPVREGVPPAHPR